MIEESLGSGQSVAHGCPFAEQMANESLGYASLANLHILGLSFRTADLALRGKVSFVGDELRAVLQRLKDAGISESMVLCTCNRTEIVYHGEPDPCVLQILAELAGVDGVDLADHLYLKSGHVAAEHIFRVCSGMDSAVLGETDIIAQVKEALTIAQEVKSVGPWLNLLLRHAFQASKRVRTETNLCRGMTSIGSLAVREARTLMGGLSGKSILVIGAGRLAERLAKDLLSENPGRVTVANRTLASAEALASRYRFEFCPLSEVPIRLAQVDVVFTAVGAPGHVLDAADFISVTMDEPLTVVDLGVPSNVSSAAKALKGVVSLDVDHLIERCTRNAEARLAAIPAANRIVEDCVEELAQAFSQREGADAIHALVRRCEEIREQNLAWAIERLGDLDPRQQKVIEDLTLRMVRGLLESPIRSLKDSSFGAEERDVVLRLFEAGGDE